MTSFNLNSLKNSSVIKGTFWLTAAGLINRLIGFLYRIFLSNTIGAKGIGIFQLIIPTITFCVALTSGGIQIAVSRFVAESKNKLGQLSILWGSLIMSISLAAVANIVLFRYSSFIGSIVIPDNDCSLLLKVASFSIPLCAFHACCTGYYLGQKKTFVPALTDVTEQIVKIIVVFIISTIFINEGLLLSPVIPVYALIIGEGSSVIICIISLCNNTSLFVPFKFIFHSMKKMFSTSYLLTLNKVCLTFLQCIEAILIPYSLIRGGVDSDNALGVYGILTGMALPIVTFPSAINNSLSTMLLPTVASANASGNLNKLKISIEKSIKFNLFTGIACSFFFVITGRLIGSIVFNSTLAGVYIEILAWLCPFMYLSINLGAILHGLGKTRAAFIHNLISIAIRLLFIWFLVPVFGLRGYLWGFLLSTVVVTLLHYIYLSKVLSFKIQIKWL